MSIPCSAKAVCHRALLANAVALLFAVVSPLQAGDVVITKLTSGLGSPRSIAIRPEGGAKPELYIADSRGRRILRVALNRPDVAEEAITGFPTHEEKNGTVATWGLQSIFFLDHNRLVVSGGEENQPFVRLYELPESSGAIGFEDKKESIDVAAESRNEVERSGISAFHSIVRPRANDHVSDMLLMAPRGAQPVTGLWKILLRANTLEDAVPLHFAKSGDEVNSVEAAAIVKTGYVVLAIADVREGVSHSELKFIDPSDGRSRLDVPTDLEKIAGLACNPSTGDLYAIGVESDPKSGGVYRLDDVGEAGKPRCRAKKIASLPNASALAFFAEGSLYVTADDAKANGESDGTLYQVRDF